MSQGKKANKHQSQLLYRSFPRKEFLFLKSGKKIMPYHLQEMSYHLHVQDVTSSNKNMSCQLNVHDICKVHWSNIRGCFVLQTQISLSLHGY
jgi:hypothetical protein